MVKNLFAMAVCLVSTCVCQAVWADELYVPSQYRTIRGAINNANDGDTVIVDEGVYSEYVNFLGKAITLTSTNPDDPAVVANTRIIGGVSPTECIYNIDDSDDQINIGDFMLFRRAWETVPDDPNWDERADFNQDDSIDIVDYMWFRRNWEKYIDDPDIGYPPGIDPPDSDGQPEGLVTFENNEGVDSVVAGFTLTGGVGRNGFGGAVVCYNAGATISNCVLEGNHVTKKGGAIFCQNGAGLIVSGCTISNNTADLGGGIYCFNSPTVTIENCTFYRNGSNSSGGAVALDSVGEATISKCSIEQNTAKANGGGIYCYYSYAVVTDTYFTANKGNNGGCLHLKGSNGVLRNCTVTGNIAALGGGIYCNGTNGPEIFNCVLAGNRGTSSIDDVGGGLHCMTGGNPTVRNCIFWLNLPGQIAAPYSDPEIKYCLVEGGWGLNNDHNINGSVSDPFRQPHFSVEGYWDPNSTESDDSDDFWVDGDYHLRTSLSSRSPCIDAGDPDFVGEIDHADIDGHPRLLGSSIDMGIDETLSTDGRQQRVYNSNRKIWYETIEESLTGAQEGDELVVNPGRYLENLRLDGDHNVPTGITLRSKQPDNDKFVAVTVIDGSQPSDIDYASTIYISDGNPGIENSSVISGLTIVGGGGTSFMAGERYGGGVFCLGSSPTITKCVISDNNADWGGGVSCSGSQASITSCVIKGNSADQFGGAVALRDASNVTVNSCAIVSNTAASIAGGLYCEDTSGYNVNLCTIKGNGNYGFCSGGSGAITIGSTILWNNQIDDPNNPDQIFADPANVTLNYCDIQNGWSGPGQDNIEDDPDFDGYYTDSNNPNTWIEHDYRFRTTSPCINAGDPDYLDDPKELDLDGNSRVAYCRVDIGACELADLSPEGLLNVVNNNTQSKWYCAIQEALDAAKDADKIVISPGRYYENISIGNKKITLKGTAPTDPNVINATVIDGSRIEISQPYQPDPNNPLYASTVSLLPNQAAEVTIEGLTVTGGLGYLDDNDTVETDDDLWKGGGIFSAYNSDMTISHCNIISNEQADLGGGIYLQATMKATIDHCTVSDNKADADGGGIMLLDCNDVEINNNMIVDNQAAMGGGIFAGNIERINLEFCTVAGNEATTGGGGLQLLGDCQDVSLAESIFWGNSNGQIVDNDPNVADLISVIYCDVQGGWEGDGNIDADPVFVDPGNGDYHLASSSPCVNKGIDNYDYRQGDLDIDGQPRQAYCRVDIGADEADQVDPQYLSQLVNLVHVAGNTTVSTWYRGICEALNNAVDNDEIIITKGRYFESIIINRNGLTIGSTDPSDPDIVMSTVVDGSHNTTENASVITLAQGQADDVVIKGLTVTGGLGYLDDNGTGDASDDIVKGGGILSIDNNSTIITHCVISGNNAELGGGLYLAEANNDDPGLSSTISYCVISNNIAERNGAGIALEHCGNIELHHNIIASNNADQNGAGIFADYVWDINIEHCSIADNQAEDSAGGIRIGNCQIGIAITNSILWNNGSDQIIDDPGLLSVTYSNVENGWNGTGGNNISDDPLFYDTPGFWSDNGTVADPDDDYWMDGDYHLQSQYGRWNPSLKDWQTDNVTSPCINAGDTGGEPVNQGAYGGTSEASKSE